MKIIDNISHLLGDDLKATIDRGSRLRIAASCFSIYAFEALKAELTKLEDLQFIFTAPTFVPTEVADPVNKERREFFIPKQRRESGLYGTDFEIQLRNKLTQRAVARECADWIRKKASFRSNMTKAPMQQFAHVGKETTGVAYSWNRAEHLRPVQEESRTLHLGGLPDCFRAEGYDGHRAAEL